MINTIIYQILFYDSHALITTELLFKISVNNIFPLKSTNIKIKHSLVAAGLPDFIDFKSESHQIVYYELYTDSN